MDIQRQAFEKEYNKHHPNDMATRLQNGNYSGWVKQASWEMWQQAQKVAVPDGFVLVPKTNSDKGIESMAMRYRHDFPLLDADYQEGIKSQMRQLYEEAVGLGFYSHKAQGSDND